MNEKILRIEEVFSFKPTKDEWNTFEGFRIVTDQQDIYILVSDQSSCCESWGHVASEDDFSRFLGAELLGLEVVDEALNKRVVELVPGDLDAGDAMFVNIGTSHGPLQFAVYNAHNGYYGHAAKIISKQLQKEVGL